jgi:hypothetical protein
MKTATAAKIEQGKTFEHHYIRFRIEGLTREQPPRVQVVQLTDGGTPAGTMWRFTEKSVYLLLAGRNPKFRTFRDLPEIVNGTIVREDHALAAVTRREVSRCDPSKSGQTDHELGIAKYAVFFRSSVSTAIRRTGDFSQ